MRVVVWIVLMAIGAVVWCANIPSGISSILSDVSAEKQVVGINGETDELFISYLEIFDMYIENLRGVFKLVDGEVLEFKDLRGSFYGGILNGEVKVTLGDVVNYHVQLDFDNLDFHWFALYVFDPGTDFKGILSGELNLSGNTDGDVHGKLKIRLRDGSFKKLPRWFTMFSLVGVNPMRANVISKGRVDMTIENGRFVIDPGGWEMHTEDVTIHGKGTIDFDGNADLVLSMVGKHKFASVFLPHIAVLWKWAEKGIWRQSIKEPIFTPRLRIAPEYKL